ncbi:GRID1 [Mytilus edulis]|uniref:GRID1 n=1 Tax=Mytilus edulis TaxID=6550 RepID=A0A8S3QQ71_MYTED|nr:GRID1 [Mytilus edulis]
MRKETYTGFTMDLLQHLALALNFTYEITRPLDGKWGSQMENGSWNGLIGHLERRDVDLVAAPLTMQIQRENAVDFAIPYYYYSAAILLKKPDPNAKKWRTLIDSLSEYIFFYFSKHRGEHLAGSSSGRTLLSSWWIFCIIMMATYSGNLVAFLTVTKDKLPFSDIAGLVELGSYKWGTQEGTVFETIFKASTRPDNVKFWKGVVANNKTNPNILSANGDVQVRLVMEGHYAYIGDKTHFELTMATNCHLTMVLSDIVSMQYAIALPNNSPFTKIFSDE